MAPVSIGFAIMLLMLMFTLPTLANDRKNRG
jgi:hypothetical protein